jgi:hypothetical protein
MTLVKLIYEKNHGFYLNPIESMGSKTRAEPIIQSQVHIDYFIFDESQK